MSVDIVESSTWASHLGEGRSIWMLSAQRWRAGWPVRVGGIGSIGLLYSDVQLRRTLRLDVYELLALHSSIVVRSRIRAIGHHASHEVRLCIEAIA